ncbi:hypothetical protein ROZALSC1DRAFT_27773 [Rozella allomycis CSF55]|uniref:O-acyltransferase n=1 Tax=Rozella allomycis (strain CSF55) TaxID=988480 RepID=A0A075AV60_ROZAC|nr:Membrane bound O-acyl transferase, MBOAT domain-containing protein [Rozella allomycis CSF55]RKP20763.1 hypothetical protein ROZALSC1DRAFT_27773 [Rozella allomycis CSF55]|eukprot:EPZ34196.1 Membrane bound O-acyl transferase, MBOAT domain-containing protein [Rozella allomycis CSF55]
MPNLRNRGADRKTEVQNEDFKNISKAKAEKDVGISPHILIKYQSRSSKLDLHSLNNANHEFRGILTFFWLMISFYTVLLIYKNVTESGVLFDIAFIHYFSFDAHGVFFTDILLLAFTFSIVVVEKMVVNRTIGRPLAIFLRHFLQSTLISLSIWAAYQRDWSWLQRSLLVPHSMVLYMKMHSFSSNCESLGKCKDPEYPKNVSFSNFLYFLMAPTLVYQLEYPRTDRIRKSYVFEKIFGGLALFGVLFFIIQSHIRPILSLIPILPFYEVIIQLLFPITFCYIIMFFLIFDCLCNFFAEITRFADRQFYEDWWNSTSFDDFARKWNKPVHHFLLRHIYHEGVYSYKLSKGKAKFLTFLFSSLMHELIVAVAIRKIKPYLFFLQMFQIPLIWFGNSRLIRQNPVLGNILYWIGMLIGPSLLAILYCREFYLK